MGQIAEAGTAIMTRDGGNERSYLTEKKSPRTDVYEE